MASSSLFTASDADDPLSKALQPPPDETPDDRARRIQQQKEAQAISHRIDEDIQESRKAFERRKKAIKILLLGTHIHAARESRPELTPRAGQAESGKSTTLKSA